MRKSAGEEFFDAYGREPNALDYLKACGGCLGVVILCWALLGVGLLFAWAIWRTVSAGL